MNKVVLALVLSVALPHIAETITAPSYFELTEYFGIFAYQAHWTMSAYLLGYTFGTAIWGSISDHLGTKRTLILAMIGFAVSCFLSIFATEINHLYLTRLMQGLFGGSVSVVPQAYMLRYLSFKDRAIATSQIGQAVAVGPAIGPTLGVWLISINSWHNIFIFLSVSAAVISSVLAFQLPQSDTHEHTKEHISLQSIIQHTLHYSIIMGLSISIGFYFFNQSRFYYLDHLNLTDSVYQIVCVLVAVSWYVGALSSEWLLKTKVKPAAIICYGAILSFSCSLLMLSTPVIPPLYTPYVTTMLILVLMVGTGLQISNSITLALTPFDKRPGVASSVFAVFNYLIAAIVTILAPYVIGNHLYSIPETYSIICTILIIFAFTQKKKSFSLTV